MQAQSVTLDFLKPVGTVVDLSDKFNARVGDSMTPFNLFVTEGGKPKALNGLHPELEAAVGDGELKDGKVVMSDNAKGIHWVGSAKNVTGYNRLTLTFPAEVFPQSGFCYGHLILANDAGVRESSVDIWFKVLDGLEIMGLAADYYDSAIELELKKLKEANSQAAQRLSEMKLTPQAFANIDDLKAKYPVGNSNLNVTVDDGHLWVWLNGGWRDCGQYQTAGLEQSVIDMIRYAFFDGNLISDGRFTNRERSVWPVTSDTQFTTITYFGQQWLQITATGNQANRGVGWNVAKLTDDLFDNQARISFKIRSSISERLSLNLQYARSDGSVITTQSISDVNLSAYTLIDFKRTISFNRSLASDTATVKLMLTKDDTSDLGTIMITDVSMKLIGVPDSATKDGNLISSGEQDNGLPSSWKYTSDTVLGVSHYLNRDWIQVTANGNSQYRGVGWTLKNNRYNDVLTYLLRIKMDVWSSIAQQLALNVAYVDKQGNTIATDSISDVSLAITSITQVDRYFKLQAPDPNNVDHINLNLVTNGTADIGTILISNVSVTIADEQFGNGNLIATSANGVAQGWGFTSDTVLQQVFHLGKHWLQITADGNNKYRGAGWTIAKFSDDMFDYRAKVKFKIRSTITQNLALNIQYLTADNKLLATQSIDSLSLAGTSIYDYEQIFDFDHSLASQTDHVNLSLVTNETGDIGNILLADIYFGLCFNQAKSDNSLIEGGSLNAQRFTSDTNLNIVRYLNRNWLQITSTGNSPYRGARWILNNNSNNDLFNYLLHIKMTIYSSLTQSMSLNITYDDSQGNILQTDSISGIDLAAGSLTKYDHYYRLSYSDPSKIASIGIALVTNGTDDLGEIRVSDIDVGFDHPTMDTSLLEKNTNGTTPAWKFNPDTQLGMVYYMNDYWLKITSTGNSPYRGAGWTILKSSNELFDHPLELTLRLRSSIDQSLALNIQYAAADGTLLDTLSVAGINLKADRIVEKSYNVQLNYADPDKVKQINIDLVTNGTDDIGEIWVSHLSAKPIFTDTVDDNDDKKKINSISKLPIMNLTGSLNGISGDKYVTLQFDYQDGSRTVKGYASTKWQGNSSVGMPKKAYRIKTYSDDKLSKKLKFRPCAEWEADSKWNLKAYYTDPLIGRDATNAKIGGAIWSTEHSLPQQLVETNNFGFIDGFPILLYINGSFAGVYSFNIAKGDYGDGATAISGSVYSDTTLYKSVPDGGVKLDASDFEMIYPDVADDTIKSNVNALLEFIVNSTDDDFKMNFDKHINKSSVIDYLIFNNLIDNSDAWGKNQTLITYDGKLWYFHPYDLDVSFGGEWDGSIRKLPTAVTTGGNRLFDRVSSLFLNDIKSRYTSLRSWLTPAYVINQYHNLVSSVGEDNYEQEYALWNNPNFKQNDFNFVKSRIMTQFKLCDKAWLN